MRRRSNAWVCIAAAATALAIAGCGSRNEPPEQGLVVLTGGSFQVPIGKIADLYEKQYGQKVLLSPEDSGTLLTQIRTNHRGDVYCAHDPFGDQGKAAGALDNVEAVASIFPVIAVRKGSDNGVRTLEDLAKPGLKIGLPDYDHTTAGNILRAMLKKKGIFEPVDKNQAATQREHAALATQLELGNLDAVVIWNSIARLPAHRDKLETFPFAAEDLVDTVTSATNKVYPADHVSVTLSVITWSNKKADAQRFIDLATSSEGRRIWAECGFDVVEPTAGQP